MKKLTEYEKQEIIALIQNEINWLEDNNMEMEIENYKLLIDKIKEL